MTWTMVALFCLLFFPPLSLACFYRFVVGHSSAPLHSGTRKSLHFGNATRDERNRLRKSEKKSGKSVISVIGSRISRRAYATRPPRINDFS